MNEHKVFTIAQVSWLTKVQRNYEFDNSLVFEYFKNLINYLQMRGLTTRLILDVNENISEETKILSSDLTTEGLELIKKAFDKWTDGVLDKGKSPADYKLLDKYLEKIRSK
jgi:hypothetical protein